MVRASEPHDWSVKIDRDIVSTMKSGLSPGDCAASSHC